MRNRREKEREGGRGKEKEKCHSDYYSFRPKRHRRNHTILLFRSREEDRRLDDLDRRTKDSADAWESCGKKMKEGGGMGRYGGKKADENWPGIDRDRWHLTWHLTNCEISLLRTGIIADQRSIYFSLPRYSLAPPPTAPQEPDRNWKFNFSPPSHPSLARHPDELNGERTAVRGKNAIVFLPRSPWSKNSFERTQESLLMRPLNRRNNSLKVEQKFIIKYH